MMRPYDIIIIAALTGLWLVLNEGFGVFLLVTGVVAAAASLYTVRFFMPDSMLKGINFAKLMFYPFFLFGQVYLSGFYVIKIILRGGNVDVVTARTRLTNRLLRVVLVNSVTLTPGSVTLDEEDGVLTLLWLRPNSDVRDVTREEVEARLTMAMERRLIKAEKAAEVRDQC